MWNYTFWVMFSATTWNLHARFWAHLTTCWPQCHCVCVWACTWSRRPYVPQVLVHSVVLRMSVDGAAGGHSVKLRPAGSWKPPQIQVNKTTHPPPHPPPHRALSTPAATDATSLRWEIKPGEVICGLTQTHINDPPLLQSDPEQQHIKHLQVLFIPFPLSFPVTWWEITSSVSSLRLGTETHHNT